MQDVVDYDPKLPPVHGFCSYISCKIVGWPEIHGATAINISVFLISRQAFVHIYQYGLLPLERNVFETDVQMCKTCGVKVFLAVSANSHM